ncbi:hypothetical protein CEXT_356461 [Caerostris extrusa]|uniref:Uncharacterized protein n=1 Tax=Caerostris extrusa TaxID=172846 RepID=A0AAV4XSA6_CAEEX|nr:hypothetical protein CEXT_356461 [Caerostris extrusa]
MEFAIYHTHGLITDMKWCPINYDSTDNLSRLGLLAVSCSDSIVRIYSIPQPSFLPKVEKDDNFYIYTTDPSLILRSPFSEACSVTNNSMATCIDWHKNGEQIAVGYGNGFICVWNIKSSGNNVSNK